MSGFTSGKISHDPMPWRDSTRFIDMRASWMRDDDHVFDPRPEFDNHNPILVFARQVEPDLNPSIWFDRANEQAWSAADEPDDTPGPQWWGFESHAMRVIERVTWHAGEAMGDGTAPPEENFWDDRTTPLAYSKGDADRDLAVKRTAIVGQILPDRYTLLANGDKQDLELRCTDCNHHLCDAEHKDTLLVLVSVAIEHETRRH